jgi:hypothetical protein
MKRTRVEIGSLVVHRSGFTPVEGAALGRMVEANLAQLLSQRGGPIESRKTSAVGMNAGAGASDGNIAGTVARALYHSIQGKI